MLNKRYSGIIMPIFSLPSEESIGTLGDGAYEFIDFLVETNQHYWQVLPIGYTSYGDSPYQSFSSYAGNPYFIDLYRLVCKGWLNAEDVTDMKISDHIDYETLWREKYPLLRKAYENSFFGDIQVEEVINKYSWLDDFSTFMGLKSYYNFKSRVEWEQAKTKHFLNDELLLKIKDEKRFHIFLQAEFFEQWYSLKEYAKFKGIEIIGDIPIFVSEDSADVWVNPEYFQLDNQGNSLEVAGVPPDYFSKDGQLWGNPLYNWDEIEKNDFQWWISRINESLKLFDVIRIDHFRGFESYWSVPKGQKTAKNGKWISAPGMKFFSKVKSIFPNAQIVAEDLGIITDKVKELIKYTEFPTMKVLIFGFEEDENHNPSPHRSDLVPTNTVFYTTTHDNDTVEGWVKKIENHIPVQNAKKYFMIKDLSQHSMSSAFIESVWKSEANIAMTTMQDLLGLDNSSRINTPSILGGNWSWRLTSIPNSNIKKWLSQLTKESHRI